MVGPVTTGIRDHVDGSPRIFRCAAALRLRTLATNDTASVQCADEGDSVHCYRANETG